MTVKNITRSADEHLIEHARRKPRSLGTWQDVRFQI